ncbi:hypothetical protein B0H14DRAFT_2731066 [Mycena olivaceomarginata]|nr:hypothetical protein B0H14DRAFT_2731066 [Mycena olivaceomarginata]
MLIRILCILATTIGLHIASTAPNVADFDTEKPISTNSFELMLSSRALRKAQKIIYWLIAQTEIFAIAIQNGPTLSLSLFDFYSSSSGAPFSLLIGCSLVVTGAALRLKCYKTLGRHFTFEGVISEDHQLVKDGPYKYIRYTGAVLAYIGLMIYYGSEGTWFRGSFVCGTILGKTFAASATLGMSLLICGLLGRIPKEDKALKVKFGPEWDIWAAETYVALKVHTHDTI